MKKVFVLFSIFLLTLSSVAQENVKWELAASGLSFPEGPAWDGNGILYSSNCYSNWILKIENGIADTFVTAPTHPFSFEKTNGLTVFRDGSIFACDYGKGAILKFSRDGRCEVISDGYQGQKFNRPNDLAFDPDGNLFFTDPKSYDSAKLDGAIYMISRDYNEIKKLYSGLGFPNGIAFSGDAKRLIVCESAMQRILSFPVNNDKTLGSPSVFADLPGGDPDGIAFDVNGNLYVAHFGGQAIYIFNPEGKILNKIATPGKKPSNVEFGGEDMRTLYITEDETNSVYFTRVEIPGLKLFNSPANP